MSRYAGQAPASSAVRLFTHKKAPRQISSAQFRQLVNALCELGEQQGQPLRRREAREMVLARLRRGRRPEEILRGAKNDFGITDETGQTAAANLDRTRWADKAQRLARRRGEAVADA